MENEKSMKASEVEGHLKTRDVEERAALDVSKAKGPSVEAAALDEEPEVEGHMKRGRRIWGAEEPGKKMKKI